MNSFTLSFLKQLESESIYIMREVAAEFKNPVMLYSVGKDSSVMVRLAQKAFYPGKFPFPLMHIDTGYKFPEMYAFREEFCRKIGAELIVERNEHKIAQNCHPLKVGVDKCCSYLKTGALLDALRKHGFDAAFGGARREEEKSRAKERVFSFRDANHGWDPRNQRPELWQLYNTRLKPSESMRVFPLSNWTELDIWRYIRAENIPVVPLYFAAERSVVEREGTLIVVDDHRLPIGEGETVRPRRVRFRTLGCYPLSGAVESSAATLDEVIAEMQSARNSERQGRLIDEDDAASMERKKREGYF